MYTLAVGIPDTIFSKIKLQTTNNELITSMAKKTKHTNNNQENQYLFKITFHLEIGAVLHMSETNWQLWQYTSISSICIYSNNISVSLLLFTNK